MEWFKKNRFEFFVLLGIIILTLFLRCYRLDEYMTFLGDEGRDALVIKRILVDFDIPLLGPPTSVGSMYLGPLYYYMMAVPMAIFWLNPVAAAGMVALIGTLTVGFIYYLSREWFGKKAAFVAALLYSVSSVNVIYSRSSWNPNPASFFALLSFFGLYKSHQTKNFAWFVLTGIGLAFAIQMHYLALILLPIFGLLWLNELRIKLTKKSSSEFFTGGTVSAIFFFLLLMSPLIIFDFKYNFMNYRAITRFFFDNPDKTVGLNVLNNFQKSWEIYSFDLVGRYLAGGNTTLSIFLSLVILTPLVFVLYQKFINKKVEWQYLALYLWLVLGIAGLSFYRQEIYDHYLGFINPVPFILTGAGLFLVNLIRDKNLRLVGNGVFLIITIFLIMINLTNSPLLKPPGRQLQRTQNIAKFVIQEAQNKPFNFALIAEHNYDAAYQFYLDQYGQRPGQLPFEKTDQLIVVCEDPVCKPVGHSKQEIAAFGWTVIESEKQLEGIKVFKLISNPDQPK